MAKRFGARAGESLPRVEKEPSLPAEVTTPSLEAGPTKAAADILGWEFAFELNEPAKQIAAESRVDVAFKKIPREVLDKRAVEQGDVRFFELGALSVEPKQKGCEVSLKLKDFLIPTDDIPEEARKAIKHWSQLIDYWAVDWDYKNDTFHNQWQTYRTRQDPKIELEAKYKFTEPGKYAVVVKVIDILGNDTTKTVEVVIKVMALAVAWQFLNAARESDDIAKDYAKTFLILAPNVIVLERLKTDFAGGHTFQADPI